MDYLHCCCPFEIFNSGKHFKFYLSHIFVFSENRVLSVTKYGTHYNLQPLKLKWKKNFGFMLTLLLHLYLKFFLACCCLFHYLCWIELFLLDFHFESKFHVPDQSPLHRFNWPNHLKQHIIINLSRYRRYDIIEEQVMPYSLKGMI